MSISRRHSLLRTSLLTLCLCLSGCAYDGSNFSWQSGGLPFLGMTVAIGNDAATDAPVRRAVVREAPAGLKMLPNMLRNLAVPKSARVPDAPEVALDGDADLTSRLEAF